MHGSFTHTFIFYFVVVRLMTDSDQVDHGAEFNIYGFILLFDGQPLTSCIIIIHKHHWLLSKLQWIREKHYKHCSWKIYNSITLTLDFSRCWRTRLVYTGVACRSKKLTSIEPYKGKNLEKKNTRRTQSIVLKLVLAFCMQPNGSKHWSVMPSWIRPAFLACTQLRLSGAWLEELFSPAKRYINKPCWKEFSW